jgi:histone H3/H4
MVHLTARTQVKDLVKEAGIKNISADYMDRLDSKIKEVVMNSVKRAQENGRRTVMGKDV